MIIFRASRAGACTRELVLAEVDPVQVRAPASRQDFLDAGHYLQEHVEAILKRSGIKIVAREAEGEYTDPEGRFIIRGHVDGVIEDQDGSLSLLEVKAIQDHNFKKLKKSEDFTKDYGYYEPQAQTYLHLPQLTYQKLYIVEEGDDWNDHHEYRDVSISGPFLESRFVFYNRNTSDTLGGVMGVESPTYTYRSDMVLTASPGEFDYIIKRHERAYQFIVDDEVPDYCDKEGWCFMCKKYIPKRYEF